MLQLHSIYNYVNLKAQCTRARNLPLIDTVHLKSDTAISGEGVQCIAQLDNSAPLLLLDF